MDRIDPSEGDEEDGEEGERGGEKVEEEEETPAGRVKDNQRYYELIQLVCVSLNTAGFIVTLGSFR